MNIEEFKKIHRQRRATAVCWYFYDENSKLPYRLVDLIEKDGKLCVFIEYPTAISDMLVFDNIEEGIQRLVHDSQSINADNDKAYNEFVTYFHKLISDMDVRKTYKELFKVVRR